MLNLSKLERASRDIPLKDRIVECVNPEIYEAESIADYKENKSIMVPPWFKRNPLSSSNYYALVIFYDVGIDGIYDKDKLTEGVTKVHDGSGSKVMCWTEPGQILPAKKSYFQMLDDGDLEVQDWVYRLIIRHSYEGELPFIAEVTKNKFTHRKRERDSLVDRITSLFPDFSSELQPSY